MPRLFSLPVLLAFLLVVGLAPLSASAQDMGHEQVLDLTYPADPRATYMDDYAHGRSGGRRHGATDLMGEKMWPIYAAVGGTITFLPETEPSYGWMITITGADRRAYSYIHLNNDTPGTDDGKGGPEHAYAAGLQRGSRVERGQLIGYMGDSGNAEGTAPHLHFQITDPRVTDPYGMPRINPYKSLKAAEARGDYATPAQASAPTGVARVSGRNRVETAVELSKEGFPSARAVVLTSAASFPDAIVAGPLAAALDAPVLTTFGSILEPHVAAEIRRLGATTAYIVGPAGRVSTQVELDLRNGAGIANLRRLAGPTGGSAADTDAVTAAIVARSVRALTGTTGALIALGSHPDAGSAWPDALTAGYHGAVTGQPVLFAQHGGVPAATVTALAELDRATIVGGTAAVSSAAEAQIRAAAGSTVRLSGRDRFETAGAVADDLLARGVVDPSHLWVATGHNYADALAAAGTLAATGDLFVLVDGTAVGGDNRLNTWYARKASSIDGATIIGGTGAVSPAGVSRLADRIR